ncbi:hypothetical protein BDR03DRAFT_258231 [Suillus americanus]|nr:hypothetical protein BDR03DRAFT_258231 [Suillus americanus]
MGKERCMRICLGLRCESEGRAFDFGGLASAGGVVDEIMVPDHNTKTSLLGLRGYLVVSHQCSTLGVPSIFFSLILPPATLFCCRFYRQNCFKIVLPTTPSTCEKSKKKQETHKRISKSLTPTLVEAIVGRICLIPLYSNNEMRGRRHRVERDYQAVRITIPLQPR